MLVLLCPGTTATSNGGWPNVDPVTAALNAFSAFNQFLCTPAGQKLADLNIDLITKILSAFHMKLAPTA